VSVWGPDPKFNPRLTLALSNARRASIPKVIIEAAIARGQGKSLAGNTLEPVTIEAMLPHSVAAVIECMAEVKGRVLQDIRHAVKEMGGSVTPTTYLFEKKGRIIFERRDGLNPDDYLDQAIEAGAADIAADDSGRLIAFTETTQTKHVGETLASLTGLTIEELEIIWDPNRDTLVSVDEDQAMDVEHMLGILREDTSVRDIYLNTATKF
jgi:transcriptional/translational regulatory protein YebC/TACO1